MERRLVVLSIRTVLAALLLALALTLLVLFVFATSRVLVWVMIALFLALALDRLVSLAERWLPRRTAAVAVFMAVVAALGGLGFLLVPPLVEQATSFVEQIPEIVERIVQGRGPLASLAERFELVERVRSLIEERGAGAVLGFAGPLLAVVEGVLTTVVGALSVAFLTLFMLTSGPAWWRAFLGFLPGSHRELGERIGDHVYRAIGGWVIGAIALGLLAGTSATVVLWLLGVPNALALGMIVALLDPIPFIGATLAGLIVGLVALGTEGLVAALIFVGFLTAYQQLIENHLLVPLVYGRTVELDALGVLLAVLIGAELAGIIGAIAAIPIGGAVKATAGEVIRWRRSGRLRVPGERAASDDERDRHDDGDEDDHPGGDERDR